MRHLSIHDAENTCERVPRGANAGYKVSCNDDGSGRYDVCVDSNCQDCRVTTFFRSDQCLVNPPQYGSASVAIRCPVIGPVPSVIPALLPVGASTGSETGKKGGASGGGSSGAEEVAPFVSSMFAVVAVAMAAFLMQ